MKRNKNNNKSSIIVLLSPIILIILLLGTVLATLSIFPEVQRIQIRNEIFTHVQENASAIELDNSSSYQEFYYTATGLQDGGVEYG